ncbi:23635_t:CDS:2 [Entrophospora sp. SA101]|nr:4176_t:CDS:2 [Entrophospora sp. SA101]CAJ0766932.1 23635_t:CDS:2 [Entrophospora sp. SA101]CAJ0841086.1 12402_t:CDS:2 [Entrophospora sp. SA101]CAJ0843952.1 1490_t:CDS:2 [Entrophospora sp. SA101]
MYNSSDELSIGDRITSLEQRLESLQSIVVTSDKVNEIVKVVERLQAEVAASKERLENLQKLEEDVKKKQLMKQSWTWLFKIIAKHVIINSIVIFIILTITIRKGKLPMLKSFFQRQGLRKRTKQLAKSALTDFKNA